MARVVLRASGISKSFGESAAVSNANLEIREGEIFGLLGPNGAGKTTLARILVGLAKADAGSVSYFGGSTQDWDSLKKAISIVPQEPSFYGVFSVRQNLEFFSALYGYKRAYARKNVQGLIEWLKLGPFSERRAMALSGGYKRLLNIACSLVNNPKIMLLDEPTVGLDPTMRKLMWEKIRELRNEGKTILLTTHYMDEAQELCDRVALMSNGSIALVDSPEALILKYGGKTDIVFKLNKKASPELIVALRGAVPKAVVNEAQLTMTVSIRQEATTDAIVALSRVIKEKGYRIAETLVKEPELEDVFLNITHSAAEAELKKRRIVEIWKDLREAAR